MHGISSLLYNADELGEHSFGKGRVGNKAGWKIRSFLYVVGPPVLWFYSSSATIVRSYSQLCLGSKKHSKKKKRKQEKIGQNIRFTRWLGGRRLPGGWEVLLFTKSLTPFQCWSWAKLSIAEGSWRHTWSKLHFTDEETKVKWSDVIYDKSGGEPRTLGVYYAK